MRPVGFGEALPAGNRLTLFSEDKPVRFFTVIKFWMDETSGLALALKTGGPSYQVEDEEGRTFLLIQLPIEENEHRWCLWRGLSLAFVHEDLPGRAPASSAVVTTTACFAMTMSSSIACTPASGSAQQSRTTTNR
jgi:hypothetical protein